MSNDKVAATFHGGAARGPDWRVTVLGYTFATYTTGPQRFRWECSARGRGVGGYRTPPGAFIALRKWLKQPAVKT